MAKPARQWLVALRGDRSQQEIADEITRRGVECSRSWYSLMELGLRDPSPEVAALLADLFGVPMDVIFFGEGGFKTKLVDDRATADGCPSR